MKWSSSSSFLVFSLATVVLLALASLAVGYFTSITLGIAALGIALCCVVLRAGAARRKRGKAKTESPQDLPAQQAKPEIESLTSYESTESLVEEMFSQGRYTLLLRRQLVGNLSAEQKERALGILQDRMAVVPEGEVVLARPLQVACDEQPGDESDSRKGSVVCVEPLFLDRYPVTNRDYHHFVVGGGYEQMALWDPEIWPAVLDFVDRSKHPGPRFWVDGTYRPGHDNEPVVGISWFEAAAYARWAGKRLPTDAEWVKAGGWPVRLSEESRLQRKYPWGDAIDRSKANLWGSGPEALVPVDEFSGGVSVGGVYQLIGNTWEWTSGRFSVAEEGHEPNASGPWKSLRGGAFDTYFDHQATCDFQSGDIPVARKYNVGFRCALSFVDLAPAPRVEMSPAAEATRQESLMNAED